MQVDRLQDAKYAWLELDNVSSIHTDDILNKCINKDEMEAAYHLVKFLSDPKYVHLFGKLILNMEIPPHQCIILQELWKYKFPMFIGSRGVGKTSTLAMYCIIRSILIPETKIVLTGSGFRQSKIIFEYIKGMWEKAPVLRDICTNDSGPKQATDMWTFQFNQSKTLAIPMGNSGDKVRGLRANVIIADEFSSLSTEIYEQVIQGFTATASDPIIKMQNEAKREYLIKNGLWNKEMELVHTQGTGNQSIIAGTCGYEFEHFAKYWKNYRDIILGNTVADEGLSPSDYCVIRYPYELIPKGIMDAKTISRAKAINTISSYMMEYCAVFVKDSEGFFKRTLIESCVAKEANNISKKCGTVVFDAKVDGDKKKKHIIAIDPASENDNLAIIVLELHEDHWRVVYCWTVNKKRHRRQVESSKTNIENYYSYCARKIRDLMVLFPTVRIVIDTQGGGHSIIEALHDKSIMSEHEEMLWTTIDRDKPKDTDHKEGAHVIEPINFAKEEFTSESNHGLKKDMEMKYLLFPKYDGITISVAVEKDIENKENEVKADSLESCIYEIEELKDELTTIVCSKTPSGRDRWDTPEQKVGNKKGRMRKDRYSALLMANYIARSISREEPALKYSFIGGLSTDLATSNTDNKNVKLYQGNSWYNVDFNTFRAIKRK